MAVGAHTGVRKIKTGRTKARRPVLAIPMPRSVDRVFQALAGLEFRLLGSRNLNLLAGTRIAANRRLAVGNAESTEADQTNLGALFQGVRDRIKHRIDSTSRVRFGETGIIGNCSNKIVLVQGKAPL